LRSADLDRLRAALHAAGHSQAVLSHPETLAALGCFAMPVEDWPVSNPFVAVPALLCLGPERAVLVVADFHEADVRACGAQVVTHRSYDFQQEPDPAGELRAALLTALESAGIGPGPTGVEALSLPHAVAEWLREAGRSPVACEIAHEPELEAVRRACRLADVVQRAQSVTPA
jgi:hypothetical protein